MQKIAEQQKQIACNTQQGYNEGDDFKAVRSMPRAPLCKALRQFNFDCRTAPSNSTRYVVAQHIIVIF